MNEERFGEMAGQLARASLDSWRAGNRAFAVLHCGIGCEHILKALLCRHDPLLISEKGDRAHRFHSLGFGNAPGVKPLAEARTIGISGPIVLVWDNLNTHVSRTMRQLVNARLWLTVYQLPPYAPEFHPVEGVWSHLKRSLANLTKHSALVKTRLKQMQYRPGLVDGLTAKTGLDFQPP